MTQTWSEEMLEEMAPEPCCLEVDSNLKFVDNAFSSKPSKTSMSICRK